MRFRSHKAISMLNPGMTTLSARLTGSEIYITVGTPRLDAAAARDFKKDCEEVWTPGITAATLDLSQVGFIDSSGIGALLSLQKRLAPTGGSVRLHNVQPPVQSVIELLRLHRIFEIVV
jgi:anti-sigma B factor antagonist